MPNSHGSAGAKRRESKTGERKMPPHPQPSPNYMTHVEQAVLRALRQHARQMDELLDLLRKYSSASVKAAVWRLIDRGEVRLERDRSLRLASSHSLRVQLV